jgi:cytochrome c-type biogenesis protein
MNPLAMIEQAWWLGVPTALLMGVALGGSPFALPVLGAGVSLGTAASARQGAPRHRPVIAFAAGLAVVYGSLGFAADRIDLVFDRVLSRSGGLAAAVLGIVLLGVAALTLLRPSADRLACRRPRRSRPAAAGAFLSGIPAGIFGCPACAGVIMGVAASSAFLGHTWYSVAVMTALGIGHGAAVVGVSWLVTRGLALDLLTSPRAQKIAAVPLLVVGGWLLYVAAGLGLSFDSRLP